MKASEEFNQFLKHSFWHISDLFRKKRTVSTACGDFIRIPKEIGWTDEEIEQELNILLEKVQRFRGVGKEIKEEFFTKQATITNDYTAKQTKNECQLFLSEILNMKNIIVENLEEKKCYKDNEPLRYADFNKLKDTTNLLLFYTYNVVDHVNNYLSTYHADNETKKSLKEETKKRKVLNPKQKKALDIIIAEMRKGVGKTDAVQFAGMKVGYKSNTSLWNLIKFLKNGEHKDTKYTAFFNAEF